ncbi:MAG: T9SS type A sorting domain-containing protein [Bacteroidetes bacterium]|nr:T9SS type A sorting domain-containing protein [Bacteroidota bacterium]
MIKKLLSLSAIVALTATTIVAQTNMGFETWGPTTASPNNPTGWETFNTGNFGGPNGTTQETADPGAGSISAKMVTMTGFGALTGGADTIAGLLALNGDLLGGNLIGGVAYTQKPISMDLLFKSAPVGGDTCVLFAQLQHYDVGSSSTVVDGQAVFMINITVPVWTSFNIPFNYFTTDTPDTLIIFAASSAGGTITTGLPQPGSTFWLDGLVINNPVGVNVITNTERIAAYPNPASSSIKIALNNTKATSIKITNITGKTVKSVSVMSNVVNVNVEELPVGLYIYQVMNNNDVVYTNKINVVR